MATISPSSSEVLTTLSTIRDYIRWAASRFTQAKLHFGHGTNNALDEAAAMVLHTIHQPYDLHESYLDTVLTLNERLAVINIIYKRINERKPAAYLTHEAIFAGLSFYVDERVLIPRSPIAELIEQHFYPWIEENNVNRILDLCTGSGCIAIACAYAFPEAIIDAVDLSEDALAVADINVQQHQVSHAVNLIHSNLFKELPAFSRYDIIVSNPPYVNLTEWDALPTEFKAEPEMGFKGGHLGLDIVMRILTESIHYLNDKGILIVEVGSSAETLMSIFPNIPFCWLEFERGGDGVFLLTAEQIRQYHDIFTAAMN